jgi:hypothetical protein
VVGRLPVGIVAVVTPPGWVPVGGVLGGVFGVQLDVQPCGGVQLLVHGGGVWQLLPWHGGGVWQLLPWHGGGVWQSLVHGGGVWCLHGGQWWSQHWSWQGGGHWSWHGGGHWCSQH